MVASSQHFDVDSPAVKLVGAMVGKAARMIVREVDLGVLGRVDVAARELYGNGEAAQPEVYPLLTFESLEFKMFRVACHDCTPEEALKALNADPGPMIKMAIVARQACAAPAPPRHLVQVLSIDGKRQDFVLSDNSMWTMVQPQQWAFIGYLTPFPPSPVFAPASAAPA